ncbi:MAG TPA: hypothetical protein VGJ14_07520 [Sporichthyaceae bacterium]|jgi:hypothetical protein
MYALFVEVDADESHTEQARKAIPETVVPQVRAAGAKDGYWLAPQNGRGLSVVVFDDEAAARGVAAQFKVGEPVGAVEGVTVRTVEVREVLAHL